MLKPFAMVRDSAYVAVASKMLQELDLSQGPLGQDLLAKDIGDLLDRYSLACLIIRSRAVTPRISPRSPSMHRVPSIDAALGT